MSTETTKRVEDLRAAELRLSDELVGARVALGAARVRESEAELSAALGDSSRRNKNLLSAASIVERINALSGAIAQIRPKRVEAIHDEWAAAAATLRETAAGKQAEADTHAEKTNELLAALKEHEGSTYVPDYLVIQARGFSMAWMGESVTMTIPRSEWLRREVDDLEHQAAQTEARPVPGGGSLIVDTRDELLAGVRDWDPRKLAPSMPSLIDWLDEREADVFAKIARLRDESTRTKISLRYTLVWREGEIDPNGSRIDVLMPDPEQARFKQPLPLRVISPDRLRALAS